MRGRAIESFMRRAGVVALALALPILAGCIQAVPPTAERATASGDPCSAEPLEPFDAALEEASDATSIAFSGRVVDISVPDSFGRTHYRIVGPDGVERRVVCSIPDASLPVAVGASYDFRIERIGGSPSASALVIRDGSGLLFAGASDQSIGGHVLVGGVPDFALDLQTTGCTSRASGECYSGIENRTLRVAHDGQTTTLAQREEVRMGTFDVRCLIAQHVDYDGRCPDFALHSVSYTIARVPAAR
jgi:hypothetical protein